MSIGAPHGINVFGLSVPIQDERTPSSINWNDADLTAVVVLTEATLVDDPAWVEYVHGIARDARDKGIPAGFFPVTMDDRGVEANFEQQALRWNCWDGTDMGRSQRLMLELTHEFCRMLRHRIDAHQSVEGGSVAYERYLEKIQVFISHSKHDGDGESVGNRIRDWIYEHSPLDSFFDIHDIPPGLPFGDVLLHQIDAGAVVAVHSASYSSREWCRREIIEAKRRLVPMVVVDCVRDIDPRGMAYLGNVPVVRMDPDQMDKISIVVSYLLDEVFRTWLWLCQVGCHLADSSGVVFTARPPELIALAALPSCDGESTPTIVYPEPLLSADEERLFREIAPDVRVRTLADWLEKRS